MRPVIPSAGALLAASGLLYLSFPAMAFVGLSSFALINEGRLLLQRARLPSHSGGLEGSPPGPPTLAQDDRGRRGDGSHSDEEEEEKEEEEEEPFPVWKGISAFEAGEVDPPSAGVIVIDPFCDYLGKRCIDILEEAGYAVVQVLSEHLVSTMNNREGAEMFRPPLPDKEAAWAAWLPFPLVAVFCESDAGLATAERLQAALLGPRFGGVNETRRDKFLMVEAMRRAGLSSTRQVKTGNWSEARELISTLEPSTPPSTTSTSVAAVVVKPARGCASGDVFLCRGEDEARKAFEKILGTPKYGTPGAKNDEVVIQEFLVGTEWVVDTVSRDGDHKVMAIWRYDKRSVNGAPFVYFSTQLMPSDGYDAKRVAEYAFQALDALGVKYGPTHTEIMIVEATHEASSSDNARGSPTLIEVNTRWHLTDFAPLTDACVGYNAVEETLSAYLDPGRFDSLPRLPPAGRGSRHGRVVHLVSFVEGELKGIHHEEEIRSMESFAGIDVYSDPARGGSGLMRKTIDIRSDAGWVRLIHENPEVVERDFRRVVELMPTMFEVKNGG